MSNQETVSRVWTRLGLVVPEHTFGKKPLSEGEISMAGTGRAPIVVPRRPLNLTARRVWAEKIKEIKKYRMSYLFMAPYLTFFSLFVLVPVGTAIYLSFSYFNVLEAPKFVGWLNYRLLFMDDDVFLIAVKNTLIFAVIAGPVGYVASFTLAVLLNQIRLRVPYTLAFYTPSILSGVAMSVIWLYFFSADRYGLVNQVLISLGILNEPFMWLQDVRTIMPVIIGVSLWMSMGTGFLAFIAGLQNVPLELYDAGKVDGIENKFQEVWHITVPMMKPMLLFGAVNTIAGSFNVFTISQSLAGFPSPLYAGHTIVGHLYDYAFIRYEMGYASAISVVLFVVTFGLGRLFMRVFSTKGEY